MKKGTIIAMCLSCLLVAYIVVMVPMTIKAERDDTFKGLKIVVKDDQNIGFLTKRDVNEALDNLYGRMDTLKRKNLNTLDIEKRLGSFSRIEKAECRILNDGTLLITVDPFDPVARVFDKNGSVYVNADGKSVAAKASYHVDVPVVTTNAVADSAMLSKLLPVLQMIKNDQRANALVSTVHIDSRGDIILIPNVVGHVINFGDGSALANKLDRLHVFYRDVMPVKGWNAFDTVSVKWDGRVVATKRDKSMPPPPVHDEVDNIVNDIPVADTD